MPTLASTPEELLARTPYLIYEDSTSLGRFSRVAERALATHRRAKAAAEQIAKQTNTLLGPYESAMRSELVAESNRMEGYKSTTPGVRKLVQLKDELLHIEVQSFLEYVRDDPRLLEDLGLYRAYMIADEWAGSESRPREFELRSLHSLILADHAAAGRYKVAPNKIGGSAHVPVAPWDVPKSMGELCEWFRTGSGDPVLDAAVVHAWLTHIHPFDDGNGRMARLLANLALVQVSFPPLLLRSGSDRGQYLDALAASDEGDILPLYDLFANSLRRMVLAMEKPNFVQAKIRAELMDTSAKRYTLWKELLRNLLTSLEHKVARPHRWAISEMGIPSAEDFSDFEEGVSAGKRWLAKFKDSKGVPQWLLWVGYQSEEMSHLLGVEGRPRRWPSIFFAHRSTNPQKVHPWTTMYRADGSGRPNELTVVPGTRTAIALKVEDQLLEKDLVDGADFVAKTLCRDLPAA